MKHLLERLKFSTFMIAGLSLIVVGAAGYATLAETNQQCVSGLNSGEFITGTFIPAQKGQ